MTFAYLWKLFCLALASFFVVHLALATGIGLIAPAAIRLAERMRPSLAARFLLGLRLLPAGAALFVVAMLCIPSYLRYEKEATAERATAECLAAALLGAAILGIAVGRALRAASRSLRYARQCRRVARQIRLPGEASPVWIMEERGHSVALAGILRPRIYLSRGVARALSAEELEAAFRHERAHQTSRDNLKRFFILLAPDALPFVPSFVRLERAWRRLTEWAADDLAVDGEVRRSLSLASALVQVSRFSVARQRCPLVTSLLADSLELSWRLDRLLRPRPADQKCARWMAAIGAGAILAPVTLLAAVLLQPETLYTVHRLLEHLMR